MYTKTKKYNKYKNSIKTKKIKKNKILKGGAFNDILNPINERFKFFGKPTIAAITSEMKYINYEYYNTSNDKLNIFYNKYKENKQIKLIYPLYHGSIINNEIKDFPTVPENAVICFFSLIGNVGILEKKKINFGDSLKNMNRKQMESILYNLSNLYNIDNHERVIKYDSYLYLNCFKNCSWYFPGQKYIDLTISNDNEKGCIFKRHMKYYDKRTFKGRYSIHTDTLPPKIKLSEYIINNIKGESIYIYFIPSCRVFEDVDVTQERKQLIESYFKHEMYLHYINQDIMKAFIKNLKENIDKPNFIFKCCSISDNYSMLLDDKLIERQFIEDLNINRDYVYNKHAEFMMEFYNKYILYQLEPDDFIEFITLSLRKQVFLLVKCLNSCVDQSHKMDLLKLTIENLISPGKQDLIFNRLDCFDNLYDTLTEYQKDIFDSKLFDDYNYIYKEHLIQYIKFLGHNIINLGDDLTIIEKYLNELESLKIEYSNITKKTPYTLLKNIKSSLLTNNLELLFSNISQLIIKECTEYEINFLKDNLNKCKNINNFTITKTIASNCIFNLLNEIFKNPNIKDRYSIILYNVNKIEDIQFNITNNIRTLEYSNSNLNNINIESIGHEKIFNIVLKNLNIDSVLNLNETKNVRLKIYNSVIQELNIDKYVNIFVLELERSCVVINFNDTRNDKINLHIYDTEEPPEFKGIDDLEFQKIHFRDIEFIENLKPLKCKELILEESIFFDQPPKITYKQLKIIGIIPDNIPIINNTTIDISETYMPKSDFIKKFNTDNKNIKII